MCLPEIKGETDMRISTVAIICICALAACNTVKGAGKDIQSVGQAGQDAINTTKKK
jgi:predicted small secreted protein